MIAVDEATGAQVLLHGKTSRGTSPLSGLELMVLESIHCPDTAITAFQPNNGAFSPDWRTISHGCCQPEWRSAWRVSHEIHRIALTAGFADAV